jgi:biofilm PGA synthesis protein PgaA
MAVLILTAASPAAWPQPAGQGAPPTVDANGERRLQSLKEQYERNPGNPRLLQDYVMALSAAGRNAELLALIPRVELAAAPMAVLLRLGRSASDAKQFDFAVKIYRAALVRAPNAVDVLAGLSYALTDSGHSDKAMQLLDARRPLVWNEIPLLEAYAEAVRAQRDEVRALNAYERILALDPQNTEALRNRIFVLARLGAPHRALELAQQTPGLLTQAEFVQLATDRAAAEVRWGAAADSNAPDRFANTDAALAEIDQLLEQLRAAGRAESDAARRLQFDRIEALRNRFRMKEAVELYEHLAAAGVHVPPHTQIAAADAYLYLEKPAIARDLYLLALPHVEDDFAAQIQLFYAYSDAEQHKKALEQIDRIVASTPQRTGAYSPITVGDNPDYASALATAGAARAYQDRYADAQRRLEAFRAQAPYNLEARDKLANVYSDRGWPRRAEAEYRWILAADPQYRDSRLGYADVLRDVQAWRDAEREIHALDFAYPEDRQVQRAEERWHAHTLRELQVDGGVGTSDGGGPVGTREHALETRLYSRPIAYDWRIFLYHYDASANFETGKGERKRLGFGADYRVRDYRVSAQFSQNYTGPSDLGLLLTGEWHANDRWTFDAQADSSSNDIPLQARVTGVDGKSLRAGATYRVSESRRFTAAVQYLDFSDENRRAIVTASAFQRLLTQPVVKLDGMLSLYTSQNSLDGAPYFNPEHDLALEATLIGEHRPWRRYEHSFVHRLYLSLGQYRQQNFPTDQTSGVRYEHEITLDPRMTLMYGAQRTIHPYDGERVYADYYNFSLNLRF